MIQGGEEQGSQSRAQDFELNLAPVVDCFTVLIAFMLVSASFISIGILEAGMNAETGNQTAESPPEEVIQLEMNSRFEMKLKLNGKISKVINIPSLNASWNYTLLNNELSQLKKTWPNINSLILSASDEIQYNHIIQCMDKIHTLYPQVLLGGF